jgi:hypothetical protein
MIMIVSYQFHHKGTVLWNPHCSAEHCLSTTTLQELIVVRKKGHHKKKGCS